MVLLPDTLEQVAARFYASSRRQAAGARRVSLRAACPADRDRPADEDLMRHEKKM